MIRDAATLRGGAIYINNEESPLCDFCQVLLKDKNTFSDNYAEIQGGAISYRSAGFQDVDGSTIYINNTAGVHAGTIASFATSIRVMYGSSSPTDKEVAELVDIDQDANRLDPQGRRHIASLREQYGISNFLVMPSGQKMNLTIELLDAQGRRVKNENVATARIVLESIDGALNRKDG